MKKNLELEQKTSFDLANLWFIVPYIFPLIKLLFKLGGLCSLVLGGFPVNFA